MPAGDGATRVGSEPTCEDCGAQLTDELRIQVDRWAIVACRECAPEARETAPPSCTVFSLPQADENDTVDGGATEETT